MPVRTRMGEPMTICWLYLAAWDPEMLEAMETTSSARGLSVRLWPETNRRADDFAVPQAGGGGTGAGGGGGGTGAGGGGGGTGAGGGGGGTGAGGGGGGTGAGGGGGGTGAGGGGGGTGAGGGGG